MAGSTGAGGSGAEGAALRGPVARAVLRIALPAIGFHLLVFLSNFVDYGWVQALGPAAAAGQTAGWTLFWMLLSAGEVFEIGITAVVARRVGERRGRRAVHAATHGMRGAVAASVLVGAGGWWAAPALVRLYAATPEAAAYTLDYLRTACAGTPLVFLFYAAAGLFKGRGDMRRPLVAMGAALTLNMVLDPLLIHVAGLEVLGAALATVLSFGLLGLILARTALRRGWMRVAARGLDLRLVGRVVRIGTPVALHGVLFSAVYVFIVREVGVHGGDAGAAALGLGLRLEGISYMIAIGFASAAAAVVGQSLGAGDVRRAHRGAWAAVRWTVLATGSWGIALYLLPRAWIALVSPGAATTLYAELYCEIVAVSVAFMGVELCLQGAFSGAGDTLPPMLLGVPLTVARIPAAMLLARTFDLGVAGVFWALTATSVLRGLAFAFWFARNRWPAARA